MIIFIFKSIFGIFFIFNAFSVADDFSRMSLCSTRLSLQRITYLKFGSRMLAKNIGQLIHFQASKVKIGSLVIFQI